MIFTLQAGGFGRIGIDTPSDVNYSNVVALLHFDGANSSTTITDNSPVPKTWTFTGMALSTTTPKFGTAKALISGASQYISSASDAVFSFGAGDYTVEGWVQSAGAGSGDKCMFDNRSASNVGIGLYYSTTAGGARKMSLFNNAAAICTATNAFSSASGTWEHWAVTRSGTTVRLFMNGGLEASGTDSRTYSSPATCFLGDNYLAPSQPLGAGVNLDDIRITKGVARYTAAFTAPTTAFPDHA